MLNDIQGNQQISQNNSALKFRFSQRRQPVTTNQRMPHICLLPSKKLNTRLSWSKRLISALFGVSSLSLAGKLLMPPNKNTPPRLRGAALNQNIRLNSNDSQHSNPLSSLSKPEPLTTDGKNNRAKTSEQDATPKPQTLHVLTFETDDEAALAYAREKAEEPGPIMAPEFRLTSTIPLLQRAHPKLPLEFKRLGEQTPWRDYCQKWSAVRAELAHLDKDTVVVVADNRDAFMNIDLRSEPAEPILRFIEQIRSVNADGGHKVVIGAEPEPNLGGLTHSKPWDFYDPQSGERLAKTCDTVSTGCGWRYMGDHTVNNGSLYIQGDGNNFIHPWESFMRGYAKVMGRQYMDKNNPLNAPLPELISPNMGLVAGTSEHLSGFLDRLQCQSHEDDQVLASGYYFNFPEDIQLDFHAEALGNSFYKYSCKFQYQDAKTHQLHYGDTGMQPLFGHIPAMSKHATQPRCLYDSLEKLGYPVHSYQNRPAYYNPENILHPDDQRGLN